MAGLYSKILSVASCLLVVSVVVLHRAVYASTMVWTRALLGITASFLFSISMIYLWLWTQRPSRRQSLATVTSHLLLSAVLLLRGRFTFRKHIASCKNPMRNQENLLRDILRQIGDTVYGKRHRLADITSLEEYRRRHPLTDYEHFRPYVDRMIDGEKDVLFPGRPVAFNKTTGTTGKSKCIPAEPQSMSRKFDIGANLFYTQSMAFNIRLTRKMMYLYVAPKVQWTERGVVIEPVGRVPTEYGWALAGWASPPASFDIKTMHEAIYIQLLFGLLNPEIEIIFTSFVSILERAVKILETSWPDLVNDIEHGTINAGLDLPQEVRERLVAEMREFGGDPERAVHLRRIFRKGFHDIIKRLWPDVKVLYGIDVAGAWPALSLTYADGVPLCDVGYGSSESVLAAFNPGPTILHEGYIPLVDDIIFEFINECDVHEEQPLTHFVNDVERGKCYEVVITRRNGLLRYRTGDVVRIVDFYNNMPIIKVLYRIGQMLNLIYEKFDQAVVLESVRAAAAKWNDTILVDFVTAESTILPVTDIKEVAPYYLFFVELDSRGKEPADEDKQLIDLELRHRNGDYERLRREGAISHPRVYIVHPGTFDKLQHFLLETTEASFNQYKLPRKLRTYSSVEFMIENSGCDHE